MFRQEVKLIIYIIKKYYTLKVASSTIETDKVAATGAVPFMSGARLTPCAKNGLPMVE